ncbi:MAG: pyruvate ferredoxin oxidoreductase [Euryarchaeota archaeon]|nr:pyruvate ferredoxin oxidoreductase [Euryarchaeota archaeon]
MVRELLSGNQAVAEAVRLARAQVIAAYPITPQTTIIERLAELVGSGELEADYITVESEHSAMAACVAASLAGARTFTATSSQGLLLMHELLHWTSGQRTPVVMANVNRAVAPPWNIWADHSDSMAQRDTGWIQMYAETNQEALDATLFAYRVAEDRSVMLPAMVMEDAFLLSHTYMPVEVPEASDVDAYLPAYDPPRRLEPGEMQLFGSFSPPDLAYMEFRRDIARAMEDAHAKMAEAAKRFERVFGRRFPGPLEEYRTDGADVVLIASGSIAATARDAVDELRRSGLKAGLVRLFVFRPFPTDEIRRIAERFPLIGVVDRAYSSGSGGPLATESKAAIMGMRDPPRVESFIAGLGGRDVRPEDLVAIVRRMVKGGGDHEQWVGLKGVT